MTDYYVCNTINDPNIEKAVSLHIEHLSYRSFITNFGKSFLTTLYKDWLIQNNAILIFAIGSAGIEGFVLGIKEKDKLFKPITTQPFKYMKFILAGLLKKPSMIFKLVETLFYKNKSASDINSELLVIVTSSNTRSKGVGSQLVNMLEKEFSQAGISDYVVTVHAEMERSNNFYRKNRMSLKQSFELYGTLWNMFQKKINNV